MSSSNVERTLDELGHRYVGRGELEAAGWAFLRAAHAAFARRDLAAAARFHALGVEAVRMAPRLERPTLIPNLLLVESELRAEAGDAIASAALSTRAIAGFAAAGDRGGVIAVWTARAERALRAGNPGAARDILAELLPALDARGDREASLWLRARLGAALALAGRRDDAAALLAAALEHAPDGGAEVMAVAAETMRVALDDDRPRDALAIGISVLDAPARGARQLHAEVLVLTAVALVRLGEIDTAERFAARTEGFASPGLADARVRLARARQAHVKST